MADTQNTQDNPEKTPSWRKFSKVSVNKKTLSKRMRQAETKTTRHAKRFIVGRIDNLKSAREHILAWFIAVAVVLVAIMGQFLLSSKYDTVQADSPSGTYAEGVLGEIRTLNPLYASTSAEVAASKLIFSSLYRYDETGALHQDLASGIIVGKRGASYDVSLRQDAIWQDGAPVTADDVMYTIKVIKNPEARVNLSLQNNWRDVQVKKIDDYTLRFTLPSYASFPHALTFPVLPSHLLEDVTDSSLDENSFSSSPVGSGPFSFKLLQDASKTSGEAVLHLISNANYYEGSPHVNRFELHAFAMKGDLVSSLETDALTAADVTGSDIKSLNEKHYTKSSYPINNGVYALMNTAQGIFADKNLRKAIQLSLDTNSVREAAGDGVPALYLPFIASQVDSAKLPQEPQTNLGQAEQILKKDKWQKKDGVWQKKGKPLAFTITTTKNDQYERVANEIANQLRNQGMQIIVSVIDDRLPNSNFVGDVLQRRNFEMLVYELQIGGDPDVYAYWHSSQIGNSGYNFTSYNNSIADAALVSARDRTDAKLRDAKYAFFARQWLSDVPAVGLYQQVFVYLQKPSTTAMSKNATFVAPADRYALVRDWTVNKQPVYKTP